MALALLVSLGLAEFAVRVFDPLGVSYLDQVTAYQLDKVADPDLVCRHPPSSQRRYGDVLVTFNERGLRDRTIGAKGDNEFRILALGDSVTFGWGVPGRHSSDALYGDVVRHAQGHPVRDVAAWWGDQKVRELMNSKIDAHPNVAGHRLIAVHMAENIAEYLGASASWPGVQRPPAP